MRHVYPVIPDIGLKVHDTFEITTMAFGQPWKFLVRSQSEANIAKSCLSYYKSMWDDTIPVGIGVDDVVVDIGAHIGFFSIPVSAIVDKVIAFEPSPANYLLLQRNISKNHCNAHMFTREAAVGKNTGRVVLNLGVQGTTGHSITNGKRGGVSIEVDCFNLDWIVNEFNPTVLKMDCEGAEWDILTDTDLLGNIRIIVAELHKVKQHSLPKLLKVLKQAGMKTVVQPNSWFTKLIAYRR